MSKTASKVDLRQQMPETAKWIEERRGEWGKAHVNECIRKAMTGEANQFYAMEAGHVVGTPFATAMQDDVVALMTEFGGVGAWMMRSPHGTN
jgi:hypothetical protein